MALKPHIVKPHIFIFAISSLTTYADKVDNQNQCSDSAYDCLSEGINNNSFLKLPNRLVLCNGFLFHTTTDDYCACLMKDLQQSINTY